MSKLRIGIDIDNVIADTTAAWSAYMGTQHDICPHGKDKWALYKAPVDVWDFHKNICEKCFSACLLDRERIMELQPMASATYYIENLVYECDLFIITSRPKDVAFHTIAWLEHNDIYKHIQEVIFDNDKSAICYQYDLDYMIEDAPKHILAISKNATPNTTQVLIYDQPYNKSLAGIRVKVWQEIYEYLNAAITMRAFEDA